MTKALIEGKKNAMLEWFAETNYIYLADCFAQTQEDIDEVKRREEINLARALGKGLRVDDLRWVLTVGSDDRFQRIFGKAALPVELLLRLKRYDESRWNPVTHCGVPPQNEHLYKGVQLFKIVK